MENQTITQTKTAKVSQKQADRHPEFYAIQKAIDLYIDGVSNHNVESLREAFHPQAAFFGWNGQAGVYYETTVQALIDHAESTPSPASTGETVTCVTTSINLTGRAASVGVTMDHYQGGNYVDYFHLLKIDNRWKIVSKTFHGEEAQ